MTFVQRLRQKQRLWRADLAQALDELVELELRARSDQGACPRCRVCGCTDEDCADCIVRTGLPCHWVEPDLCSACVQNAQEAGSLAQGEADGVLARRWTMPGEAQGGAL